MAEFKFGEITEKIIGAVFRVHNALGNGFQEVTYQRSLEIKLKLIELPHIRELNDHLLPGAPRWHTAC